MSIGVHCEYFFFCNLGEFRNLEGANRMENCYPVAKWEITLDEFALFSLKLHGLKKEGYFKERQSPRGFITCCVRTPFFVSFGFEEAVTQTITYIKSWEQVR